MQNKISPIVHYATNSYVIYNSTPLCSSFPAPQSPSPLNPHQIYGQTKTQQLSADDQSDFGPD